jgi:hypothetical protein
LKALPSARSGHDGDGEDSVEILAVDCVEPTLFEGAEGGKAGLRESARAENKQCETENEYCAAHSSSLLNGKTGIGEASVEGDAADGDGGPRRAVEREIDLRGVGDAGSGFVGGEIGVQWNAGSGAAAVAADEGDSLRKAGVGVEPEIERGEAGELLKVGLRREGVLDAEVLEGLLADGFESDVLDGFIRVGEGGGEERERKADGLAGDGSLDGNACAGRVDGFASQARGIRHGICGLRESDLLGGLIGAAGEDADGAGGGLRTCDNGDTSRGN